MKLVRTEIPHHLEVDHAIWSRLDHGRARHCGGKPILGGFVTGGVVAGGRAVLVGAPRHQIADGVVPGTRSRAITAFDDGDRTLQDRTLRGARPERTPRDLRSRLPVHVQPLEREDLGNAGRGERPQHQVHRAGQRTQDEHRSTRRILPGNVDGTLRRCRTRRSAARSSGPRLRFRCDRRHREHRDQDPRRERGGHRGAFGHLGKTLQHVRFLPGRRP